MTAQTLPTTANVVLEGIRWTTFEALLEDLGDHRGRATYDGGRFELMSPSKKHEAIKKLLARLIELYALEMGIDIESLGSTTFRRPDLERGIEPDECYYVQHAAAIRGRDDVDLTRDPPPDLVVEAEVTRCVIERLPIYAALGVPEVWRHNGERLRVERLGPDGVYRHAAQSGVFPHLPIDELDRFLVRRKEDGENAILRAFLEWVRAL